MRKPSRVRRGPHGRRAVWFALLGALAIVYLVLGLTSTGGTRVLGIASAMLVGAGVAFAGANHPLIALGVVIVGAIPLPVHTWWSIITPVHGSLTIAIAFGSGLAPAPCRSTPGLTTWTSTQQPRLSSIATDRRRG